MQWISVIKTNHTITWIVIYRVDRVIHLLSNPDQAFYLLFSRQFMKRYIEHKRPRLTTFQKTEKRVEITKHSGSLINDFPGVWNCGQARSFVFKICSRQKLKLRIKWRNKIVKIDPNKDQIFKHRHGHAFLKRSRVPDKKKISRTTTEIKRPSRASPFRADRLFTWGRREFHCKRG